MIGALDRLAEIAGFRQPTKPIIPPTVPEKLTYQEGGEKKSILTRKYVLMCLVEQAHLLTRKQIEELAQDLYQDTLSSKTRPLASSCARSGILEARDQQAVFQNPILNRVALSYEQEEMERKIEDENGNVIPWKPGQKPRSPVDWAAGSGPARPLIKELYSLYNLRALAEVGPRGRETFEISDNAKGFVRSIDIIMSLTNWERYGNPLIIVGKRDLTAVAYPENQA